MCARPTTRLPPGHVARKGCFMIKRVISLTAAGAAILTAGCASTGVHVDEATAAQFQDGRTSYNDVVGALGQPTSNMMASNGERTIMYTYAHAQVRAATLIPVVGIFAGGMDTNSTNAIFTFDSKGVLKSHSTSRSQYGTGSGVVSGAAPSVPSGDQPRQ